MKASVGDDNSADIELDGEASEAAKAFANNGYLAALNGNMEICDEKSKECNRMMICGTDLCNTFEPTQWKDSTLANDCPAGKWKNGLGGMYFNRSSRRKRGMASNPLFIIPNLAMATLGLKEMGTFLWEGREKREN